jgi:hypothetical protein
MSAIHRRHWIQSVSAASLGLWATHGSGLALPSYGTTAETSDSLATQLYKSLNDQQKNQICLPKDHPSRSYVSNWWYVHPNHRIPSTFTADQQELIKKIFDSLHSAEYQSAVNDQVLLDQYGEKDNAPAAGFFGSPEDDDFEFIFTGHHVTRRCSAHTSKGQGFGGNPIFYGHYPHPESDMRANFNEAKDHPGNPYWYQGKLFNRFVAALDGKQQAQGLVAAEPRSEQSDAVIEIPNNPRGLNLAELSPDQKKLFIETVRGMLAMFRSEDVDSTIAAIEKHNIVDRLHVSWYGGRYDLGSDRVWDTWQIEGPDMVWYFRGYPHIHCYFHLPRSEYTAG